MNEHEIIAACRLGRPESFRSLVEAFGPLVMATAINVLGNREDAQDAFQETFLRVFRNIDRYDPRRSFKTWLLTIAYRRSLDMIRKKRRFTKFAVRAAAEMGRLPAHHAPDPLSPPALPSRFLEGLSPRERAALCLWANEGYTAGEISEVLCCSSGTARVYLFNARRKIKSLLEADHGVMQNG
jgi:RNA polymerase sigma-70 factor (ECF subfamily)